MTATTFAKCTRCQKKYRSRGEWNAVYNAGIMTGILCPACQTPEENAEAVINQATTFYGTTQPAQPADVAELLVNRCEKAVRKFAELAVDTGISFPVSDVVKSVIDGLPAVYLKAFDQPLADVLTGIVQSILDGSIYEGGSTNA